MAWGLSPAHRPTAGAPSENPSHHLPGPDRAPRRRHHRQPQTRRPPRPKQNHHLKCLPHRPHQGRSLPDHRHPSPDARLDYAIAITLSSMRSGYLAAVTY